MPDAVSTAALLTLWGIVIPALWLALRRIRREKFSAEHSALCRQAQAIVQLAVQSNRIAAQHPQRTAFFDQLHHLPAYRATLVKPPPARSAQGKQARLIVLDMQARFKQTLRSLQHHRHTALDDRERSALRDAAQSLAAKLKEIRNI